MIHVLIIVILKTLVFRARKKKNVSFDPNVISNSHGRPYSLILYVLSRWRSSSFTHKSYPSVVWKGASVYVCVPQSVRIRFGSAHIVHAFCNAIHTHTHLMQYCKQVRSDNEWDTPRGKMVSTNAQVQSKGLENSPLARVGVSGQIERRRFFFCFLQGQNVLVWSDFDITL